ncbi:uracil-DNA glycosylase [Lysobacter sp. H23M47]|uniref:uracil-DNA glycosylase n=1 Tax=Lysobacter sp. H23M47 TaxID=2781024 RepID=UPI0018826519|nr:uracil-DNA glycosylase [Lysobacter sp. H23M47]QOW24721.1 uracil-DNA glycosylase [Lysobacter sp. H23M47]
MEKDNPIRLETSWRERVGEYLSREDMQALAAFLRERQDAGARIHPPPREMFAGFDATPFDDVRVVILGQDPYHGPDQAHGLSFSVRPGVAVPPSLRNIYKELERDLGLAMPAHGCLLPWAKRGVLLLNAVLSVEEASAGAHVGKGWEGFTDHVVATLDRERDGLVFLLWGAYAQKKGAIIDRQRHKILRAPHPSPLSAHRGFIGCGHFSAANEYLVRRGGAPIDWSLPDVVSFGASERGD